MSVGCEGYEEAMDMEQTYVDGCVFQHGPADTVIVDCALALRIAGGVRVV